MQRNILDESCDYLHVEGLDAHEAIVKNLEPVQCTKFIDEVHQPPLNQRHRHEVTTEQKLNIFNITLITSH